MLLTIGLLLCGMTLACWAAGVHVGLPSGAVNEDESFFWTYGVYLVLGAGILAYSLLGRYL
jgi:hypothetical protein